MIYVLLYAMLVASHAASRDSVEIRKALFGVAALLLFALVAFRYEVGCDWWGYAQNFELARYWDAYAALERSEPGFWLVLVGLHGAGLEYPYLNLVMAIPFFWGLVALAKRESDPFSFLVLSFPVLIINMPMSALRQAVAIGMLCLAIKALQAKKSARYSAFIICGSLFHTSSIIFMGITPFVRLRLTRGTVALAVCLMLPGAYFMLLSTVEFYFDRYVNTGVDAAGGLYRAGMLAVVGAAFLLALRTRSRQLFPNDYQIVLIGSWVMVGTLALVPVSSVISDRFGYYVTPIQLMILSRLPHLLAGRASPNMLFLAPHLGLGAVLAVWASNSALFHQCYLPYKTWLSWVY